MSAIPFNIPDLSPADEAALLAALREGRLSGDGTLARAVEDRLREITGSPHVLAVTSATHALELSLLLLNVGPGDTVLCPSFAFPSTPNAILLRGARPVFVDICADTLDMDPADAARVADEHTVACMPVDYGGVGCDIPALRDALPAGVPLILDAAHGIGARRDGRHLGTHADMGVLSFHATKNITSGEGGALMIADAGLADRAEVLREKGTNRAAFMRGEVPLYEWTDVGSSWVMSDLLAALLLAQLERLDVITAERRAVVARYDEAFADLFASAALIPQTVPASCQPNGHLYVVRCKDGRTGEDLRCHLASKGITAPFHFVPLHTAAYARKHLGTPRSLPVTEHVWNTIVRLPVHTRLSDDDVNRVIDAVRDWIHSQHGP